MRAELQFFDETFMNTMKTMPAETDYAPKQRGFGFWLSRFALLLGLGVLFYYGYCWSFWGRSSLLLQYLFQCSCPVASEEARYPDNVDVIVSACKYNSSILSPSGRLLYVQEEESGLTSTYLLDLQTDEKPPFTLPEGSNHFLTDDLMFHSYYGDDEYILDIATGKQYPIHRFARLYSDAYINGELNLSMLAEELREAKDVFLIDDDIIVAITSDFRTYPEHNFITGWFDFPGDVSNRLEQFLRENEIAYHYVTANFPHEAVSPDGRFVARADGIYVLETDQKIVEGYSARAWFHPYSGKDFSVRGWISDNSGVIYSKFLNPCLIEASFFLSDEPGCFFEVPQPLLKLKVPEEYVLPSEMP